MTEEKKEQWELERKFDFSNGVHVPQSDINRWHRDVLASIINGASYNIVSSGNSMVIGKLTRYSHDPDNPVIEIFEIPNGYEKFTYTKSKNSK